MLTDAQESCGLLMDYWVFQLQTLIQVWNTLFVVWWMSDQIFFFPHQIAFLLGNTVCHIMKANGLQTGFVQIPVPKVWICPLTDKIASTNSADAVDLRFKDTTAQYNNSVRQRSIRWRVKHMLRRTRLIDSSKQFNHLLFLSSVLQVDWHNKSTMFSTTSHLACQENQ